MLNSNLMTKTLFLPNKHTELEPASQTEPHFKYLNRCGRKYSFKVREVLEKWFKDYPGHHKKDLCGRFQSNNNSDFISSFSELYMHELLIKMNYAVEIHPQVKGGKKTPDFLVSFPGHEDIYIEVTTASKILEEGKYHRSFVDLILDKINEIDNQYFHLDLYEHGFFKSQPKAGKIKKNIERWLNSLDYNDYKNIKYGESFENLPKKFIESNGCKLEFTAIPRNKIKQKNKKSSLLSAHMTNVQQVNSTGPIKRAIKKKGRKYGDLGKSYIIAINLEGLFLDQISITEALFGQEELLLNFDPNFKMKSKRSRKPNGAWTSTCGPIYRRVSAVIIGNNILPWTIATGNLTLYYNPWTKYPLSGPITKLDKFIPKKNRMEEIKGIHPRKIFKFPKYWPGNN